MKNTTQYLILSIGFFLTFFVFYFFISISIEKNILGQELSSIATTIGGFASALAFLWIIITVILQSIELSLQKKEMTELKEANIEQANALKYSNKLNLLKYTNLKSKDLSIRLKEIVNINEKGLEEIISNNLDGKLKGARYKNFRTGIKEFITYFLVDTPPEDIDTSEFKSMSDLIEHIPFDLHYNYEYFITLQALINNMEEVWEHTKSIYKLHCETEQIEEYFDWEMKNGIFYYSNSFNQLVQLKNKLEKFNRLNKKGNPLSHIIPFEKDYRANYVFNYKKEHIELKKTKYNNVYKT